MGDLPRGVVTFLFTDIEASTRLWERDPLAMQQAVRRHDQMLAAAVTNHQGFVYKHVGDAVQAAFASSTDALAAAVAAQRALAADPWPETGSLRVRMALHAGEAAPDPSGDYHQVPALNRLARLLATGHGGQILLSAAVAARLEGNVPAGVTLIDLGKHRLRDLLEPERVSQVVIAGLPGHFPPLRSLERHATNLPLQSDALIGRTGELAALEMLLAGDSLRLVTLTGPGGIGKTRLALQVAANLLERFDDGVFFVDLAPLRDPSLVLSTIAATLGVRETAGLTLRDSLVSYLGDKHLLLLLDNYEHLLDAAPVVADLLASTAGVRIVATSRTPLRLKAEHEFSVDQLPLPERDKPLELDQLGEIAAVALFVARAQAVRPDFRLTPENAAAVAEVCRRLDGLPLAIELAAARVKLLPLTALLHRLERRLPLLTSGPRDAPARHRTLRDAIAWSHDLLSPADQVLFRRLGVFSGGWSLDRAEAVVTQGDAVDVFSGHAALVDASLVRQTAQPDGEPRYTMLETIREFAEECLAASDDESLVRMTHASAFLSLSEQAEPLLRGPEQDAWFARLDREHDNLREALRWCENVGRDESCLRLAGSLAYFWEARGQIAEGRRVLDSLLSIAGDRPSTPASVLAKALSAAGTLAWLQADFATAQQRHQEALEWYREAGDDQGMVFSLNNLGVQAAHRGDHRAASRLFASSLERARNAADHWGVMVAQMSLGTLALETGDFARAVARLDEALIAAQRVGDRAQEATVLVNIGEARLRLDDDDGAEPPLARALALFRAVGQRAAVAHTLVLLAELEQRRENLDRAMEHIAESIAISQDVAAELALLFAVERLAALLVRQGKTETAVTLFAATEAQRDRAGAPLSPGERAALNQEFADVRSVYGPPAFETAWQMGRLLSWGETVALASEQTRLVRRKVNA